MNDKAIKKAVQRGFTLIELMIVIVILGVLMGTVLPRLTGAQGRARDTARAADLSAIAQALITYRDDFGTFPGTSGTPECIDDGDSGSGDAIAGYLKGDDVPNPPNSTQETVIGSDTCTGTYMYIPVQARGQDEAAFVLVSDVETYQLANLDTADAPTIDANVDLGDWNETSITDLQTADETDSLTTVYFITGQ